MALRLVALYLYLEAFKKYILVGFIYIFYKNLQGSKLNKL